MTLVAKGKSSNFLKVFQDGLPVKRGGLIMSPLSLVLLSACSGGGGGSAIISKDYEGKAVAGPLKDAIAFLDLDGNAALDPGEPFVRTTSDGSIDDGKFSFTLDDISKINDNTSIVVKTDELTIDKSSGATVDGLILKAPESGASVVTPATTLMEESGLTSDQVRSALKMTVDPLTYDPYEKDFADMTAEEKSVALEVEQISSQIVATVKSFAAAAEGVGLGAEEAVGAALRSVAEVVSSKAQTSGSIDFSDSTDLELVVSNLSQEVESLSSEGENEANAVAFTSVAESVTGQIVDFNTKISEIEDLEASSAKNIFSSVEAISAIIQTSAELVKVVVVEENLTDSDQVKATATANVLFAELDVEGLVLNEAPTDIAVSNLTVIEKSEALLVGSIAVEDDQLEIGSSGSFDFELAGDDADYFAINQGQLFLKDSANFSVKSSYALAIRVTDDGGKQFVKEFIVNVEALADDAPVLSVETVGSSDDGLDYTGSVVAGAGANTSSGALSASDESGEAPSFKILGVEANENNVFSAKGIYGSILLNGNTGEYTYSLDNSLTAVKSISVGGFAYESFPVVAFDGVNLSAVSSLNFQVEGVDDAAEVRITGVDSNNNATIIESSVEDASPSVAGRLEITDVDSAAPYFTSETKEGIYGLFELDGKDWKYTLDNSKLPQNFGTGDTLNETFSLVASDDTSVDLTVTLSGSETGAVLKGPLHQAIVYYDYDGNGQRTPGEPFVTTDEDGSYVLHADAGLEAVAIEDRVVVPEDGTFQVIVEMTTDTVDYTSGEGFVDSGIALKAAASEGGVVTPMTTIHEHSKEHVDDGLVDSFSADDLRNALGLGDLDINILTVNTHDGSLNAEVAHEVEVVQQHLLTTTLMVQEAIRGACESSTLSSSISKELAHEAALDSVVKTVLAIHEKVESEAHVGIDLSLSADLQELETQIIADLTNGSLATTLVSQNVSVDVEVMDYVIDHASAAIVSVNAELDKLHFEDFGGIKAGAVSYLKQDVAAEIFNMASAARSYHDANETFDGFNPDVFLPLQNSAQMDAAIEVNKALVIDHLETIQPVVTIETPIEQFSLQENSELDVAGDMVSSLSGRPPNSSVVTYKVMYKASSTDLDGSTLVYQGEFGELKLNPNTGSFFYSLNDQASSLNSGDVGVDSFNIAAIVDGYYSDPQAITINVAGDTDAVVDGNLSGTIAEDDNTAVVSGTLTISDPDIQDNPFFASGDYSGQYGSVNLDGTVWVYVLDQSSVQYLSEDQAVVDTVEITASDGTSATVTVTITGTEDSPIISGDVTGSIVEVSDSDANATINGSIQITDADNADSPSFEFQELQGSYGVLTLQSTGQWSYTLDNASAATDALNVGQIETDDFTVTSDVGLSQSIVISITGSDDSSEFSGALSATVSDVPSGGAPVSISGVIDVNDPDLGQSPLVLNNPTITGQFGVAEIVEGNWTYELDKSKVGPFADIQLVDTLRIDASDGSSVDLVITINTINDVPVLTGSISGSVLEGDIADAPELASGIVELVDIDADVSAFPTIPSQSVIGTYGVIAYNADQVNSAIGSWVYTLDQSSVQLLDAGDKVTDVVELVASDGTTHALNITVTGTDDVARVSGEISEVQLLSGTTVITGNISINDVDENDNPSFSNEPIIGSYGTLTLVDDVWSYSINHAEVSIVEGEIFSDIVTLEATNGSSIDLTFKIKGLPSGFEVDRVTLGGGEAYISEDTASVSGILIMSDGVTIADTNKTGDFGSLIMQDGSWEYQLSRASVQYLSDGDAESDSFNLLTSTGENITIDIVISGLDDATVVTGVVAGSVVEANAGAVDVIATGSIALSDVDQNDTPGVSAQTISGDYGVLNINPDLNWTYTLDHVKAEELSNAVVYNEILEFVTDDSSVHQINISITGTDDVAVISGVLSGETTEGNIGDTVNISGSMSITDVDSIDTPVFVEQSRSGIYGELTLNAGGDWNYLVNQSSIQSLDAGVEVKDTITIVADDFSQQQIVITLTGSDDTSVYSGNLQGEILEGDVGDQVSASSISGSVSISDIDSSDNPTISTTLKTGQYGTLSVDNGSWTYVLNEDARDDENPDLKVVQSLAQGESLSDNISISASDGTSVSINITIRGTNDGPDLVATSFTSKIVTEDSSLSNSAEGKLIASDVEGDTSITFSLANAVSFSNGEGFQKAGSYGSLFLEADGSYSYILDNGLYSSNILGSGQTGRDNFVISIADSAGAKTDQTITFEILGADESAIITGALIGGPIQDAFVFLDRNNDGVWSEGEGYDLTDADGNYEIANSAGSAYSIVAVTEYDSSYPVLFAPLDSSSGSSISKFKFSADSSASVVGPASTLMKHASLTVEDAETVLGYPADINPIRFNPYDTTQEGYDAGAALQVEILNQQLITTIMTYTAAAEGSSATANDASDLVVEALARILMDGKLAGGSRFDPTASQDLTNFEGKFLELASEHLVSFDQLAFNSLLSSEDGNLRELLIETNEVLRTATDLTSQSSKNIFSTGELLVAQARVGGELRVGQDNGLPAEGAAEISNAFLTSSVVNAPPSQISLTSASISEAANTLAVGTINVSDDTDSTFTFELLGPDADAFEINNQNGILSFKVKPDFEAPESALGSVNSESGVREYSIAVNATDAGGKSLTTKFTVGLSNTEAIVTNENTGLEYESIQEALDAAVSGHVLSIESGHHIVGDLLIDKSVSLKGANFGETAALTADGVPVPDLADGTRTSLETWIDGTITVAASDVSIDGFRLHTSDGSSPLIWDESLISTADNANVNDQGLNGFELKNSYVTGYLAGNGPNFFGGDYVGPSTAKDWKLEGNFIGGVITTADHNGAGSLYLSGLEDSSVSDNIFWRPGAAHLYVSSLTNVEIDNNNFYHGVHASGANFDGKASDFYGDYGSGDSFGYGSGYGYGDEGSGYGSGYGYGYGDEGSGYGYGYGYGGTGYGEGYGGTGDGSVTFYGRNYWLELKGVNENVEITNNSGKFNSGGIQIYGESEGYSFENLLIESNTFSDFVNADPSQILPSGNSRHKSGFLGAINVSIEDDASASNIVVKGNTVTAASDQVYSGSDVSSLIQVVGNVDGLEVSDNALTWLGTSTFDQPSSIPSSTFAHLNSSLFEGVALFGGIDGSVLIDGNTVLFDPEFDAAWAGVFADATASLTGYGQYGADETKITWQNDISAASENGSEIILQNFEGTDASVTALQNFIIEYHSTNDVQDSVFTGNNILLNGDFVVPAGFSGANDSNELFFTDGTAPTVATVSIEAGDYKLGANVGVQVIMSEQVTVEGDFIMVVNNGGHEVQMTAAPDGKTFTGTLTVKAGMDSFDMTVKNGTVIKDTFQNPLVNVTPTSNASSESPDATVDVNPPNPTFSDIFYNANTGIITLAADAIDVGGTNGSTDVKGQLDWTKLTWDINSDAGVAMLLSARMMLVVQL